jgi:sialate O-acetylesterase
MKLLCPVLVLAATLSTSLGLMAEVSLPKILASHMVIQRDKPVHIWGDASPGEKVSVEFHGTSGDTVADDLGRWSIYLAPQLAGGPYTLTVRGTNTLALDDILVGDLWLASGQSNMEMPLAGFPGSAVVKDADKEISDANHPEIRLIRVEKQGSDYPLEDVVAATPWEVCTPESAKSFSAVAYFFGRSVQQHEKVPIGLIDTTWGGTPAATWLSLDALGADASLMPVFAAHAEMADKEGDQRRLDAADKVAASKGLPVPKRGWHPQLISYEPAALYNAMIAPFTKMPIRGVIWYQGETDSGHLRAELYRRLFPALITDWRNQWQEGNFPFLFVQLAGFGSTTEENWPIVREAQRKTLSLSNTGMAVAVDIGVADNVHPPDKQTVGERLSLLARSVSYGENVVSSGPLFRQAVPQAGAMHIWFDHAKGLEARGGTPLGFEIAGADGNFVPATAKIDGETIWVNSPSVGEPRYVRYAWKNFPQANLYNQADLPASPFTSK